MSGPCPHSHPEPQDAAHVQHALDAARARCEAAGENWTEPRRRTYALLVSAGKPVKAYDLIQQFGAGVRATKPPTVYRSLDLLMGIGLEYLQAQMAMGRMLDRYDALANTIGVLIGLATAFTPWRDALLRFDGGR